MRSFVTPSPLVNLMARAAFQAGNGLIRDFGEICQLQGSCRGLENFVSTADKKTERILYETLRKAYPASKFLMEEVGVISHGEEDAFLWIIDPINGKKNFLHGVPHFSISIGLKEKMGITAGVIYDPIKDEMFWAAKGCGTFLNQTRLRVSGRNLLKGALLATGEIGALKIPPKNLEKIENEFSGIRISGSIALDLAYVAAGRYDGFFEYNTYPWDIAASCILLSEAGGFITDHTSAKDPLQGGPVIAGNEVIHRIVFQAIGK